jgi:flavin reductase (DIM6/NTAB) family NADH-FMN oxidoreductase RutF
MIYTKNDIEQLDRITRLKIINSVTGIKPANLIGTISDKGDANLAIFSSIVHLGSNPALLGFISRPKTTEVGHTLRNIQENGFYTINHIQAKFVKNAHYTSAKFAEDISEFEQCKLSEEYVNNFKAPFVKESTFKMGMRFKESVDIKLNDTAIVIGEIESIILPDKALINGDIDLEYTNGIGISGLNSYYSLKKIASYPLAKTNELPDFTT